MKIEYTREIRDTVIRVSVKGIDYTDEEKEAFEAFGAPSVHYEQECSDGQSLHYIKNVYSGIAFSFEIKLDLSAENKFEKPLSDINTFIEGFTGAVQAIMQNLMIDYRAFSDQVTELTTIKDIKY